MLYLYSLLQYEVPQNISWHKMKTDTAEVTSVLSQSSYIKVKKTGFFASLFLISILMIIIATNFWLSDKAEQDRRRIVHTHEVEASLYQVILALKDAETGQRGYLLTIDKRYLEPYTNARARIDKLLINLQLLTSDNISQQDRLLQINSLIDKKLNELDETITLVVTQQRPVAIDIVKSGKGKKLMDRLLDLIDKMANEEAMLLVERRAGFRENRHSCDFNSSNWIYDPFPSWHYYFSKYQTVSLRSIKC